jgi:hypothetical protein
MNKTFERLHFLGMAVLFIGLILKLNDVPLSLFVYGAGVLPVLGLRIYWLFKSDANNHRKNMILVVSAIFLSTAAVAMYLELSWWIVPVAIAAVIDLYISFRIKKQI